MELLVVPLSCWLKLHSAGCAQIAWLLFALFVPFNRGQIFNVFCELHSHLGSASLALRCWFVWFFLGCLRLSLHQIGQQFAFNCPGRRTKCYGCSPIKVKENFTQPRTFQRFQICPDIVFLQLFFVNCFIRYTVEYRCITCFSILLDN